MSPRCFNPASKARVPPIWPAPTNAILLRAMRFVSSRNLRKCEARLTPFRPLEQGREAQIARSHDGDLLSQGSREQALGNHGVDTAHDIDDLGHAETHGDA